MTVNTVPLSAGKASFRFSGRMHTMLCVSCDFYSSVSLITYTSWKETSTFKYYSIKCSGFLPLLYLSHNAFPSYTAAEHYKRHRILIWYRKINSAFYLTHLLQLIPLDILTFILCYGTFGDKTFKKNQIFRHLAYYFSRQKTTINLFQRWLQQIWFSLKFYQCCASFED